MINKIALTLCLLLLIGTLCVEGQRDGRRRSGRRKPTTESPPPVEEMENEKNPQKVDAEPETSSKDLQPKSSSAEPIEPETKAPSADKEPPTDNKGGPPFIVPRGTRKPRPRVHSNGEQRPRPTLPSFARKRGPKPERREFKKNDDNSVVSTGATTSTTSKPSRGSSRNRGQSHSNAQERSSTVERTSLANEEGATETSAPKKRFGGGATRRPSRGNRRYNAEES